jgi:hypothetical protein
MSASELNPKERMAAMEGEAGAQMQYEVILERSLELIDQAFDFFSFVPTTGVTVKGGHQEPYLQLRD